MVRSHFEVEQQALKHNLVGDVLVLDCLLLVFRPGSHLTKTEAQQLLERVKVPSCDRFEQLFKHLKLLKPA